MTFQKQARKHLILYRDSNDVLEYTMTSTSLAFNLKNEACDTKLLQLQYPTVKEQERITQFKKIHYWLPNQQHSPRQMLKKTPKGTVTCFKKIVQETIMQQNPWF